MSSPAAAPGNPGSPPHWATGPKTGVGTALGTDSSVSFTLAHGIVDEVFYPFVDRPAPATSSCSSPTGRSSFPKRRRTRPRRWSTPPTGCPPSMWSTPASGAATASRRRSSPTPAVRFSCNRPCFVPLKGNWATTPALVLLNPHIGNAGAGNSTWTGDYKGVPMLSAQRGGERPWLCTARCRGRSDPPASSALRRLGGRQPAQEDGVGLRAGRGRQRRPHRRGWRTCRRTRGRVHPGHRLRPQRRRGRPPGAGEPVPGLRGRPDRNTSDAGPTGGRFPHGPEAGRRSTPKTSTTSAPR